MITGFTVLFVVGSLICGVATSSTMLILGRAVAGLGTSGIQNGALTIIAQCVPLHKRPGTSPSSAHRRGGRARRCQNGLADSSC